MTRRPRLTTNPEQPMIIVDPFSDLPSGPSAALLRLVTNHQGHGRAKPRAALPADPSKPPVVAMVYASPDCRHCAARAQGGAR